jgi:hypothetical protein
MDAKKIRQEIDQRLENIPADILMDILEYLKSIEGQTLNHIALARNLKKILEEDKKLLDRLAQ